MHEHMPPAFPRAPAPAPSLIHVHRAYVGGVFTRNHPHPRYADFLAACWVFDPGFIATSATAVDKERTQLYRQVARRSGARASYTPNYVDLRALR